MTMHGVSDSLRVLLVLGGKKILLELEYKIVNKISRVTNSKMFQRCKYLNISKLKTSPVQLNYRNIYIKVYRTFTVLDNIFTILALRECVTHFIF